ncbi:hypothetical protein [Propioniciclava sinopodophylli]|uniref:hypothetical protein n=1 Tax=Propioniciclava sinopodophylli TaxID=1837344 RepID=UPI00249131FF|nr:hypothetical protein [Propioniciclava sinopodophylli]
MGELRREMRRHGGFPWWLIPGWGYGLAVAAVVGVVLLGYARVNAALRPPPLGSTPLAGLNIRFSERHEYCG